MKKRFSRSSPNILKRYVAVTLEKGKVILDSDWNETECGIVLVEMFAYMADMLSYYQDRVAEEAFLSTASARLGTNEKILRNFLHTAKALNAINPPGLLKKPSRVQHKGSSLP